MSKSVIYDYYLKQVDQSITAIRIFSWYPFISRKTYL